MDPRRVASGLALCAALAAAARAQAPEPLPEPGEAGSHASYLEALRREEARLAGELLARYERRLAEAPGDLVAAMERCRFLGAAFYDPDTEENPREEERSACVLDVEKRFATHPDARVFAIEERFGDEAVEAGRAFLADPPPGTEPRHLAAVHAHLARQLDYDPSGDPLADAERAMELDPSLDLRLLVARARIAAGDRAGARAILIERLADTRERWELEEKGSLLADLGAFDAALAAFREVERRGEEPARRFDHARALAGSGHVEEARRLYAEAPRGWTSPEALQAHFEFELQHGSPESARAAYDDLRAKGWDMDLFGRSRLALLAAHPRAPWRWADASGLVALAAVALALALLPAGWIVPIHGVGLLRGRRAVAAAGPPARFALRHAWAASAVLILAEALALYVYPEAFDGWEGDGGSHQGGPEVARLALVSAVASAVGLLLLVRRELAGLLAAGRWGLWRTLAGGVLLALGLHLLVSVVAWMSGDTPSDAFTTGMMESVRNSFGLGTTLLCVALLVPLAEELVFRGVMLSAFQSRLPARWANAAQAALFGAAHAHPILTPAFFAFGLVAGRMTLASGSLRAALIAHGVNNAFACVALALTSAG